MHSDLHTDLDNRDSIENNLRHSAKGSNDAYDVTFSLTLQRIVHKELVIILRKKFYWNSQKADSLLSVQRLWKMMTFSRGKTEFCMEAGFVHVVAVGH